MNEIDPYELANAIRLLNSILTRLYRDRDKTFDVKAKRSACEDIEICRRLVLADLREAGAL